MILLIDNYDSFTFNLYQYFEELRARTKVIRNDKITVSGIRKLKPRALVVSPGPGNPDSAGVSLDAIRELAGEIPILGVCLGHQAIGQAFGGQVIRAPRMMHGKLSVIRHDGSALFKGLPSRLRVTRYHSLIVEKRNLPKDLIVTATSVPDAAAGPAGPALPASTSNDGLIMGLRHRRHPVYGVQFHPESVMTEHGKDLLKNFLAVTR